jgi:ROK family protein
MSTSFRIGIDVGGTKIEGGAVNAFGSVLFRHRVVTPAQDYRGTIDAIIALINRIQEEIGTTAPVGIGIPGVVSPTTGLVKNANSTWLIGRPVQRDIETALGRPTRLANDANCFALSEATDGAGAGVGDRLRRHPRDGCGGRDSHQTADPGRRQRNRRRMGAQSAASARARRGSGTSLLVRPVRVSRDVPVGSGAGNGPSPPFRSNAERTGNRRGGRRGRSRLPRDARTLHRPARPRTGFGHQLDRSGCGRARGRAVEYLCALRSGPSVVDPIHLFGSRRHLSPPSGPRCVQWRARRSMVMAAGRRTVKMLRRDCGPPRTRGPPEASHIAMRTRKIAIII